MELDLTDFHRLELCLEGFFFGTISVYSQPKVAKALQNCPIPGIYSGIFAMYLQHNRSQKRTDKARNILFYALWILYALSAVNYITFISKMSYLEESVSMDDHGC